MNEKIKFIKQVYHTRERGKRLGGALAAWCKATRQLFGYTQDEWAVILGVNQSAVSRIEKGEQQLSASQYLILANSFTVNVRLIDPEIECDKCRKHKFRKFLKEGESVRETELDAE